MPPLTPGAYLKYRRTAAGLAVADVASLVTTDPRTPEHLRADQLELIEADVQPASAETLVALQRAFTFSWIVLARLEHIAQGHDFPPPRLCRICACSQFDGCLPSRLGPCSWVEPDLCSSCTPAALERLGIDALGRSAEVVA